MRRTLEEAAMRRVLSVVDGVTLVEDPHAVIGRPHGLGGTEVPERVTLTVRDRRAWSAVARNGSAGIGEGYFRSWWDTDDLVSLLRLFIRNVGGLDDLRSALHAIGRPVLDPIRRLRRPNPDRDRRNVSAHYDLSNEFFEAFLDETMTYSSAVFETPDTPLAEASTAKLDRLCRKLRLQPDHELVEIGTGWGSFAAHAASAYGVRVTTTTVSAAPAELSRKRFAEAGMTERIDLREADYRSLTGTFDRLASIEMIEAVDWRDVPSFMATCSRLLAPDGLMGLQAIVVADQRYSRTKVTRDFISRWVFPGGCLPSITSIANAATRATDLRIIDLEDFGLHYAETLRRWRGTLQMRWDDLRGLGLTLEMSRLWDFYLAYCEAAFRERHVSVVQVVLAKSGWRPDGLALRPV
jgi:cyclopropane-fatty-acyl-phospholipid synthase